MIKYKYIVGDKVFILNLLNGKMTRPIPYGWFHIMWISLTIVAIIILYKLRNKYSEKQLKWVLGIYGIGTFILELLKQILWSYDFNNNTWDYTWYSAPFQFCTMPLYISLICLLLKKSKLRDSMLSFIAFYTILGSFMTIIMPDSCFVSDILINIHTMYLHCFSFVLSIYLIMNEIKSTRENFINGYYVFLVCVFIALLLDISFYKFGFIGDETFNMFYISPYFPSTLPVFNVIYENVPYLIFMLIYLFSIFIGGLIVFSIVKLISKKLNAS